MTLLTGLLNTRVHELFGHREQARDVAVALEQENAELQRRAALVAAHIRDAQICECIDHEVPEPDGESAYMETEQCERCWMLAWLAPDDNPAVLDDLASIAPF